MHSELKFKSYKTQIHKRLFEEDYDRRVETTETMLPYIDDPARENLIFLMTLRFIHLAMFSSILVEYEAHKNQQKPLSIKIKHQKLMSGVQYYLAALMGLIFLMKM